MRAVTKREFAAAVREAEGEGALPSTMSVTVRAAKLGQIQKLELSTAAGEQVCLTGIKHDGRKCEVLDLFNAVQAVGGSSKVRRRAIWLLRCAATAWLHDCIRRLHAA